VNERDFNELRGEVDELRRRLDEHGALLRRTHQGVTGLADSVGQVVSRQRRRDRGVNLNSFVAYLLFTLLIGTGFFALYRSRAGDLVDGRDAAVRERDEARARVTELLGEVAERDAAAQAAHDYYALLRDNRRGDAISRYPEVERSQLTPTERELFAAGVQRARSEMVDAGYLSGLDAYRQGEHERAISELSTALAYEDEGPRAAQMRYYLGLALAAQGDHAGAARALELSLAGRIDKSGVTDARFHLAAALEALGDHERARAEYDRFAGAHPGNPLAGSARRKSAQLARPSH
jgi:TolA-binding protein